MRRFQRVAVVVVVVTAAGRVASYSAAQWAPRSQLLDNTLNCKAARTRGRPHLGARPG